MITGRVFKKLLIAMALGQTLTAVPRIPILRSNPRPQIGLATRKILGPISNNMVYLTEDTFSIQTPENGLTWRKSTTAYDIANLD